MVHIHIDGAAREGQDLKRDLPGLGAPLALLGHRDFKRVPAAMRPTGGGKEWESVD